MDNALFTFGTFCLNPSERLLLKDGRPMRLGSRSLDILIALIERAGETLPKEELLASIWPGTVVEEGALRVHIAALRKALGDGRDGKRFIVNTPGRGYSFVAPVSREHGREIAASPSNPVGRLGNLPSVPTHVIGRSDIVATVLSRVSERRLLTIVGAGGIGKTTIAIAAADAMSASYPDGVWFVGLATLFDGTRLPGAVGAALGMAPTSADPLAALGVWLRDKHMLIVFDCCEHVADAVAAVAETIIRAAPHVRIVATSREPLRAQGEHLLRLPALDVPPSSTPLTTVQALSYSAVLLFCERATATLDAFTLADADVSDVVEICHKLDGIPLAIELAAAQVDTFGIRGIAARLGDRLGLLTRGRRTALPHHQTLRAAIDWSYEWLPQTEQTILRRAAVFTGEFPMDVAGVVCAGNGLATADVLEGVANLVAKSLIAADISGDTPHHWMLDTTRAYALEKLAASGELHRVKRLHAEALRDLFQRADAELATGPTETWHARYGPQAANLRSALEWAFSPDGDVVLGVSLAARATNFWLTTSLLGDCCDWGTKAVSHLPADLETRDGMILRSGLGLALTQRKGITAEAQASLAEGLKLAVALKDPNYQRRALYGLWLFAIRGGKFREALLLAEQYRQLADTTSDASVRGTAHSLLGIPQFLMGEVGPADTNLRKACTAYPPIKRTIDLIRYGLDLRVGALSYRAMTLWTLGLAEQAASAGSDAISEARATNHPGSLCFALAPSCILLVKMGETAAAERCIDELIDHADKHSFPSYHAFGICAKGALMAARGDPVSAEQLLRSGLHEARRAGYQLFYAFFLAEWSAVVAAAGRLDEGLAGVDAARRDAEESESLWCMPEILRIQGELLAGRTASAAETAEQCLMRSLNLARRQNALAWELRTAISLASYWRERDRSDEARHTLGDAYRKFTEGFATADLVAARDLLGLMP